MKNCTFSTQKCFFINKLLNFKWLLPFFVMLISSLQSYAASGLFDAYAILNIKGAGNTYRQYSSFNAWNIGSFASGETLVLNGAQIKTYKNGGSNVTGGQIAYKIYRTGASASFSYINLPFGENYANPGDQRWENNSANINVLSGLTPGNYTLEVFWQAYSSDGDHYYSNGGANYKATFTITGNYYSKSTGNLELTSSWGTSTNGSGDTPPDFTTPGNTFNIRNNATPTIGASWTVSGTGSKVVVGDGTNACNFTVPTSLTVTSTATDVSNNGTITMSSSGSSNFGTMNVLAGGTYVHNRDGGTVPNATWNAASTCRVTGVTTTFPSGITNTGSQTNMFGSFEWNCPNQSGQVNFAAGGSGWTQFTLEGNFIVNNTGSSELIIGSDAGTSTSRAFLVKGNFQLANTGTKSELRLTEYQENVTLTVNGNVTISSGTLEMSSSSSSGGSGILNVKGNFTHTGGTITETGSSTGSTIAINGTTAQTIESTGRSNTVLFSVAQTTATGTCSVAAGKTFVNSGSSFTVTDNTSTSSDFTINGTFTRADAGTITFVGATVGSGGTYDHNYATGSLPSATWAATSTLLISADLQANNFAGVTFGNVTFRNTAGTTMFTSTSANGSATIAGNLNLSGTGTVVVSNQASFGATLSVTGNLDISGNSTLRLENVTTASATVTKTIIVTGNYSQSTGTLDLATNTSTAISAGSRAAILEVKGNFTHTGGTITETASDVDMITRILLSGTTGTQTLESTGQTGNINFNVAGSNAQCVISATKTFNLSSGSTFTVGTGTSVPDLSINGTFVNSSTTTISTTATTGTWAVNNGGNFVHNSSAGISTPLDRCTLNSGSSFTYRGNGAPSAITPSTSLASGRTYHHLIFESTSGTWSATANSTTALIVNGNLTVGSGVTLNFSNTGTPTPANSIKGNISVAGTLNFSPASAGTVNLNGSSTQTISGAGTFTTGANATLAVGASSTIDFGATNTIAGSGTFTTASGSTLITANTSGINGSLSLTNRSLNAGTNYTFNNIVPSAQVTGAALTSANNITLNNSAGLTLSANTSITGTLTLTSGKLTTNGFTLTLSNAVSGGSTSNYIVADATGTAIFNGVTTARLFPIGTSAAYAPMTVTAGSSTNYTAYVTGSSTWPGSCTPTTTSQMVNLAWGLSGSTTPSQVVFQWPASSHAGSFAPATSCDLGRYNSSCPYNVTNISAASGSGPYTLTCTTGLGSISNIYVIGNQHAVYIAAPTVTTTVAASSITNTAASSGGETLTGTNITSKGVVWNTSTAPTVALSTKTNDGTGTTNFTSSITSLSPQTLYYIRAYATNAAGTGYGDEKTFRTLSNPATVQATSLVANATSSSNIDLSWTSATFPSTGATNKGYVLLRATAPNNPTLGNSNGAAPTAGSNTTIVSSVIAENATSISSSALAASTQYNYLLIPYTWDGTNATTYNYLTASAPTANATTQSGSTPPVLTTNSASSVLSTAATLNGEITSDGGSSVTARGFVYSTSDNTPTIGEGGVTDQASGSGTGTFNSSVSSLSPNTTYYYQAYATSASGTSYGGVVSFTTLKAEPSAQATSLVFSSITTSSFSTAFTAATGSPDGYLVVRSTSASLSGNPVDGTTYTAGNSLGGGTVVSVGSTISGISNSSLSAGMTYYTFVFAYNNSGSNIDYRTTSPLSASTITLTDAPATPTFSSITTSGFTVDWVATTGASSYKFDVSTVSDFTSYVSGYQDLTVNGTSQAVTGLSANTLYYTRIRAVNTSGTSANSTSGNSATLPNAPTVGTASSITTSGLTSNWTAPGSQGAVTFTYTIELSANSSDFSSPVSTASNIASGTTTNAFSSLSEGTTYYYRIKAVNSAGSSAWSSVSAGATTLTSSISLTALGTNFTQDFNTLANSGTSSSLPSGWYIYETGASANNTYTAGTGSSSTGDCYSFGAASNSERSFGSLATSNLVPYFGAKYVNNTGSTINNLVISYTGETWRVGAINRSDRLDFQYSLDATSISNGTWTNFNTLDYSNTGQGNTASGSLIQSSSISDIITGLTIADGSTFFIRWSDPDISGSDDGMGIDDFSIKPCGTVSAPTASNQAFCSAVSPTVASLTATGTAVQWYSASTGGTALSTSTALTNSTTYYATQTVGGCESVTRTAVVVTINTNPSAPTGSATQTLCTGATVADLSATGTAPQWYSASSGGSALATNTALVNGTHYYASQTTNSCESTTRLDVTAAIVSSGSWIGGTSTDWSNSANWCGGVPSASTSVTVPSGTTHSVVLGTSTSINSLTINSGATVSTSGTPTITIANNGSFANNGTFTAGTSKVSFAGNGTVSGTVSFNNVDIAGGVNFGSASTINGTLSINSGGYINTNAPLYGVGSTLKYNTGGTYGRGSEWAATSGQGAPYSVQLSNSTTLNYPNTGSGAFSTNLSLAGNLTIDNGSALYMDYGGGSKSGRLDVAGNVLLNGNLSFGNASGGDLKVGGNWTRNSGSTLYANDRAIFFTGSGSSTITGNGGETFTYMVNEKTGGSISLGNNLTLTAPNGGNALTHKSTASIDLNNYDLTFSGPNNSNILAGGACSITGTGNVLITSNTKNLTVQNSGSWTFGSNVNLKLQSGLNFGNNISTINGTLEINSGGFVSEYAPNYASGSILKYNSGTTYGRNVEWYSDLSSGTGVPANVLVSSNTTLNLGANNNAGFESTITGNLTLDGTLSLAATAQFAPLNVLGNVIFNNGGLTLSTSAGGDIKVGGNWSGTGTFTPNSRAVFFNGTGNQTISRNDNFPYLFINKASGILTFAGSITLNNKLTYTEGSITFSGGSMDASGASAEVEFANSGAYTLPTGFFSGSVNKLTLNGTGGVTLSENVTVTNSLKLTSGVITLGSRNLTLTGGLDATGNGNSSSYINTSGSGALIRSISTAGVDYKFPVGLSNYSPISVNFTGGTISSSSLASRAVSGLHSNATDGAYIRTNLFWEMNQTGMTNPQYNVSFTYPGVTNGTGSNETESNLLPAKWSESTGWLSSGSCSVCFNGTTMGTSSINTATKTITWNGVSGFSDFGGFGQGNGSPLPVELLSFNGTCNEGMVDLTWQTASEFNSAHFDVEKSRDGENWILLTTVPAAGTSNELLTYQTVDNNGTQGNNYYRLRQVDFDGTEKLYDPINVSCEEITVGYFTSYPNPSGTSFQLVLNNKELIGNSVMNIVDASGKLVNQFSIEVKEGINVFVINQELSPGIYFLHVTNGKETTPTLRHAVK